MNTTTNYCDACGGAFQGDGSVCSLSCLRDKRTPDVDTTDRDTGEVVERTLALTWRGRDFVSVTWEP